MGKKRNQKYADDDDDDDEEGVSEEEEEEKPKKKKKAAAKAKKPAAKKAKPAAPTAEPKKQTPHKSDIPTPTDDQIAKALGMSSFLKGSEYYEQGKVASIEEKDKTTLLTKIKGRGPEEYQIECTFTDPSDASKFTSKCTCPVGGEGKCKHVACLLLSWQEKTTGEAKERAKRSNSVQALVDAKLEQINDLAVPALKEALKLNGQSTTGAKAELQDRVAFGMAFGALPRCPKCSGGKLKVRGAFFLCPGYMEDDEFIECDFLAPNPSPDIKFIPWKSS